MSDVEDRLQDERNYSRELRRLIGRILALDIQHGYGCYARMDPSGPCECALVEILEQADQAALIDPS